MGDTAVEADERFLLRLANPVGAAIADGEGVATIRNNDSATRRARQTGPLFGPAAGAAITAPPLLSWRPVVRARFYNVQLYRKGRKILSSSPSRPRLRLRARWKHQGRTYRLTPGVYTWAVWPAYGKPSKPRHGKMLGQKSFRIVARKR